MERSNYHISLDIRDNAPQCRLDMNRGDTHRRLYIRLTDGGMPYTIRENVLAVFTAKRTGAPVLYNRCEIEENQIIYDITAQTTAVEGILNCQLRLYSTDGQVPVKEDGTVDTAAKNIQLLSSATFGIQVHPTVYTDGEVVAQAAEVTALSALVSAASGILRAKEEGELNGVSATHRWDGTVLHICSASGESSADLKGEKGDPGEKGEKGDRGELPLDDRTVGSDGWSSKVITDRLCPAFTETGPFVRCEPVEGYPLGVQTQLPESEAGYSSLTLTQMGKNLYDISKYPLDFAGYIDHKSGNVSASANYHCRRGNIPVSHLRGATITQNYATTVGSPGIAFYGKDGYISGGQGTVVVPKNAEYMRFSIANENKDATDIQFEIGSVPTAFAPYRVPESYTVQFDTPVTGGSYCWDSGVLTDSDGQVQQCSPILPPALAGTNTLFSSAGETTVSGRADPVARLVALENAILALGGNI